MAKLPVLRRWFVFCSPTGVQIEFRGKDGNRVRGTAHPRSPGYDGGEYHTYRFASFTKAKRFALRWLKDQRRILLTMSSDIEMMKRDLFPAE